MNPYIILIASSVFFALAGLVYALIAKAKSAAIEARAATEVARSQAVIIKHSEAAATAVTELKQAQVVADKVVQEKLKTGVRDFMESDNF